LAVFRAADAARVTFLSGKVTKAICATLAARCAGFPVLLAQRGPARTRPSMGSNMRAFSPRWTALLGACDARNVNS
jgi:hypothetical protein